MKTTVRTNIDMLVNTLRKISYAIADNAAVEPPKPQGQPESGKSREQGGRS